MRLWNPQDVGMTQPSPDLIGATEACERIGIDRSTLTRWVQLGKIAPAFRLPSGLMLFHPADVAKRALEYAAERVA